VTNQRAVIGIAGPLFCLAFGVLCWVAFRRAQFGRVVTAALSFGIRDPSFFGNLMSISFKSETFRLSPALQAQ
jgi:hypothetical protein